MERIPKNTIVLERQIFLSKLKRNPLFLLLHLRSLFGIVWRKYRTRILKPVARLDSALKKSQFKQTNVCHLKSILDQIPERSLSSSFSYEIFVKHFQTENSDISLQLDSPLKDPEDYLAQHRWGNLLDPFWDTSFRTAQLQLPKGVEKWLDDPPPTTDPAWETYSACERVANLLTWLSFIPKTKRDLFFPKIISFLQFSLSWIASHLELHGRDTNNHILNNARALIMGGVVLQNDRAVLYGIRLLKKMLPALIQPNGFLRERSSHYQLIVLTWLLDCLTFLKLKTSPDHFSFLEETIHRVRESAAYCCDADGYLLATIGDISPDLTPTKTSARLLMCYPNDWPLHCSSLKNYYDDWTVLKTRQQSILLNFPIGKFPHRYPTHAHTDLTSFVWHYQNEPILIDAGRSRYTKDAVSSLQKSALGHNVVLVNGFAPFSESLVDRGNWWPFPHASATMHAVSTKNRIVLQHDGYQRATPVKHHQREISLLENGILVEDSFKGSGEVNVQLLWHLHHSFSRFSETQNIISNGKMDLTLEGNLANFKLDDVIRHPVLGWDSPSYGVLRSHPVLLLHQKISLPCKIETLFKVKICVE